MASEEELKAEIERLRAENESLKKPVRGQISLKVSEKGGLSVYGLGRFPVTLYREQWEKLLAMADSIRQFILDNDSALKKKEQPAHWHATISIAAMRQHKHVLCQKPMAHSVGEARRMAQVAREMKVATGLPVNNPSSESTHLLAAWIADGAIGQVREIHNWSGRPYWPQGIDRPTETQPVPDGLDWDLWVGPAPERPFNKAYLPFVWRGWYDFGCGSFGELGCYSFAGLFQILDLAPPTAVEASSSESFEETYPKASIVRLEYPAHDNRASVKMAWYDGGIKPDRPAGMLKEDEHLFVHNDEGEGVMYVGDKGIILAGFNGDRPRVYPESKKYQAPQRQRGARANQRDGAVDQDRKS